MTDVPPAPHAPTHALVDDVPEVPDGHLRGDVVGPGGGGSTGGPGGPDGPGAHGVGGADVVRPGKASAAARGAAAQHGLALAVTVVLLVVGVAGWAVTGLAGWTGSGRTVAGIGVNPLQNVVHLALGAAGLALWRRPGGVRGYGLLLAVVDGLVLVYGLAAAGTSWDVLGLNRAALALHLAGAVAGLAVAAWPRPERPARRSRNRP